MRYFTAWRLLIIFLFFQPSPFRITGNPLQEINKPIETTSVNRLSPSSTEIKNSNEASQSPVNGFVNYGSVNNAPFGKNSNQLRLIIPSGHSYSSSLWSAESDISATELVDSSSIFLENENIRSA